MESEIEVKGRKFKVRELLAVELDDIDWADKNKAIRKQVMLSTGITDEEYDKLTVRERMRIIQEINSLNGFPDFQNPVQGEKTD